MRRWVAAGAGAWAALALAGREPFRRRAGAFAAWWALTWLMLDWHIGMVETEDGRERNLGAADACTLVRVWLVPAAADTPAPWMCALAFATDGLDGRLARASEPTRIGRDLEGLADWAFAAAALRGALRRGWLGRGAGAGELVRWARASATRSSSGSARRARPTRACCTPRASRRRCAPPGSSPPASAAAASPTRSCSAGRAGARGDRAGAARAPARLTGAPTPRELALAGAQPC